MPRSALPSHVCRLLVTGLNPILMTVLFDLGRGLEACEAVRSGLLAWHRNVGIIWEIPLIRRQMVFIKAGTLDDSQDLRDHGTAISVHI